MEAKVCSHALCMHVHEHTHNARTQAHICTPARARTHAPLPAAGMTEAKARWMRLSKASQMGELEGVMQSGDGADLSLRPDPRLWEGTKFITGAASPPDLTASLWCVLCVCALCALCVRVRYCMGVGR